MSADTPQHMAEDALLRACREQTQHFLDNEEHDTQYCFEIFRRVLVESEMHLLDFLMTTYRPHIRKWILAHPGFEQSGIQDPDELLGSVFMRFYRACKGVEGFAKFQNLESILGFLRTCVRNLITDILRRQKQPPSIPLEDWMEQTIPQPQNALDANLIAEDLWACIRQILDDEDDIRLARYAFLQQLKPSAIAAQIPGMTARQVSKRLFLIRRKLQQRINECH